MPPLIETVPDTESERRIAADRKAIRDRLVEDNMKLARFFARRYCNDVAQKNWKLRDDLEGYAFVGLVKAANWFVAQPEGKLPYQFTAYASVCIRREVRRGFFNDAHLIGIAEGIQELVMKYTKMRVKIEEATGDEPDFDFVCSFLEFEYPWQVGCLRQALEVIGRRPKRSIDFTVENSNGKLKSSNGNEFVCVHIGDVMSSKSSDPTVDEAATRERIEAFRRAKAGLPPRHLEVLDRHFGLDGRRPETLTAIAAGMKVTRERVRQIKDQAVSKLRREIERNHKGLTRED